MSRVHLIQTNFSSGELEPTMAFRVDTGAFQNGARRLRNAQLLSTGGARSRMGTIHKASLIGRARLLAFEFSADQRYCLALSNTRLDVYSSAGALVTTVTGCVWTTDQLFEITYAQQADVMVLAHSGFRQQIIRRTGASTFTVGNFTFDQSADGNRIYQPYFKFADDAVTLSASGTTGSVTLTASSAVLRSNMVGERLRWEDVEILITAYTDTTHITGTVKGELVATYDINPFRTTIGSGDVEVTHVAHGFATGETITLSGSNGVGGIAAADLSGSFTITVLDENRYTIGTAGTATESIDGGGPNVKWTGNNIATRNWLEPVFCTGNGWPAAVCFHEGRLWFGGSGGVPDGLWSSRTYQYFNFDAGEGLDTDSIQVTIGSDDISNVRHLVSHRDLQIFTALGEFYAPVPTNSTLTPTTVRVRRQTPYGSSTVTPLPLDGATLYVQASGTALREYIYSNAEDGYASTNLNVLSSHLIDNPHDLAVLFGTTRRPEQYAFIVNEDGSLAVFHSARSENLAGWTWWDQTDAGFDAVCVLGTDVFFSVERDGGYHLEMASDTVTLDGTVTYTSGTATTSWTVASQFWGATVSVTSGNYSLGEYTVGAAGELEIDVAMTTIDVGHAFTFEIHTLPAHLQLANGPKTGLPKRVNRVIVGLDSTLALSISGNRLELRQVTDDFSVEPQAFTGTKEFYMLGYSRDPVIEMTRTEPLACTVLGLLLEVTN